MVPRTYRRRNMAIQVRARKVETTPLMAVPRFAMIYEFQLGKKSDFDVVPDYACNCFCNKIYFHGNKRIKNLNSLTKHIIYTYLHAVCRNQRNIEVIEQ